MRTKAVNRTKEDVIDIRTALSLLPGKLIARQRLEDELEQIRAAVTSGERPGWIALMPGIEMELEQIREGLGVFDSLLVPAQRNGHHEPRQKALESAEEQPARRGAVEIDSLFSHKRILNGKPVLVTWMIKEFLENDGLLDSKKFAEKWKHEYSFKAASVIPANIALLRKRGLKIEAIRGGIYKLLTPLKGHLPEFANDTQPAAKAPAPLALPAPSPPAKPAKTPKFEGTVNGILLQEMEAGGGQANLFKLSKKYGYEGRSKTSRFTFHVAMNKLRKNFGYRFEQGPEKGVFRLTGKGRERQR